MATQQELLAAVEALKKGTMTAAQQTMLRQTWGTAYDAKAKQYGPTSEAGLLAAVGALKAGTPLSPAQTAALKQTWGTAYDAKVKQYAPAGGAPPSTTPAPITPQQPTPPPATAQPAPPRFGINPPAPTPPADSRVPGAPAGTAPKPQAPTGPMTNQQLLAAVEKVKSGTPLSPYEQESLRNVWGTAYDAKVKQYGPTSEAGLLAAVAALKAGKPLTEAQSAALKQTWGAAYNDKIKQYTPTTAPATPGTPGAPGAPATQPPYTPSPQPGGAQPTVPTQTNFNGLDSTDYPAWLTALLADPVKLAKPESAAAINNYLTAIGDKRSAAQWMTENAWRVGQDTFNMSMTVRQQKMAEWQALEQAKQKEKELALQEQKQKDDMALGTVANENEATANQNQNTYWQGQNENNATANENQNSYWQGQNENNATANANQNTYWQGQNENNATANANQNAHWQDTIAFQKDELKTTAELERENQQNQLTQSRYSAFGRAKAPNTRSLRSWG